MPLCPRNGRVVLFAPCTGPLFRAPLLIPAEKASGALFEFSLGKRGCGAVAAGGRAVVS
jgi:hypothetical protein